MGQKKTVQKQLEVKEECELESNRSNPESSLCSTPSYLENDGIGSPHCTSTDQHNNSAAVVADPPSEVDEQSALNCLVRGKS